MKKKFARYIIPKKCQILLSDNRLLDAGNEREELWEIDDTNALPHTFTAVYKLIRIKKAKNK